MGFVVFGGSFFFFDDFFSGVRRIFKSHSSAVTLWFTSAVRREPNTNKSATMTSRKQDGGGCVSSR